MKQTTFFLITISADFSKLEDEAVMDVEQIKSYSKRFTTATPLYLTRSEYGY